MLVRVVAPENLPICPVSTIGPINPLHELHEKAQDAAYNMALKNADGELIREESKKIISELQSNQLSIRMRLYKEATVIKSYIIVEAYFYMCHTCGLILPATNIKE